MDKAPSVLQHTVDLGESFNRTVESLAKLLVRVGVEEVLEEICDSLDCVANNLILMIVANEAISIWSDEVRDG